MDIYTTPIKTMPGLQRCSHVTPVPRIGQVLYRHTLNGTHLFCHMDERTNKLAAVYIRDVHVLDVLTPEQRAEIEHSYVRQEIRLKLRDEYRTGMDYCERSR